MRTGQNLDFFLLRIYFDLSLSLFFFPSPFFIISSFVAHFIVFLLHRIVAGQLFQRVGKQRSWRWIFPQKVTFFCESNSARIGQNIQKKISLESSIFGDVVAHQFVNLHLKLNGSRKEDMHRSTWKENDQSSRRGVKRFRDFLFRI